MEVFKEAPVVEIVTEEIVKSDVNPNISEVVEAGEQQESVEEKQVSTRPQGYKTFFMQPYYPVKMPTI